MADPQLPWHRVGLKMGELPVVRGVGVAHENHHPAGGPGFFDLVHHKRDDAATRRPHIQGTPGVEEIIYHVRHDQRDLLMRPSRDCLTQGRLRGTKSYTPRPGCRVTRPLLPL